MPLGFALPAPVAMAAQTVATLKLADVPARYRPALSPPTLRAIEGRPGIDTDVNMSGYGVAGPAAAWLAGPMERWFRWQSEADRRKKIPIAKIKTWMYIGTLLDKARSYASIDELAIAAFEAPMAQLHPVARGTVNPIWENIERASSDLVAAVKADETGKLISSLSAPQPQLPPEQQRGMALLLQFALTGSGKQTVQGLVAGKINELAAPDVAFGRALKQAEPLFEVLGSVPWPHDYILAMVAGHRRDYGTWEYARYFYDVGPQPVAKPFFAGVPLNDPIGLIRAGYFPRAKTAIERDVARWLVANADAMAGHFNWEVRTNAKILQEQAKRRALADPLRHLVAALGGIVSIVLPGAGLLISAAMSGGYRVYARTKFAGEQLEMVEKIKDALGISDAAMEAFAQWIREHATVGDYVVKVEGESVGHAPTASKAMELAKSSAAHGDRFEIISTETGKSVGAGILAGDEAVQVPKNLETAVKTMEKGRVKKVADVIKEKREPGFPWWTLIPIAGALL